MKRWLKSMEKIYAAISFAEVGEHETAREMVGISFRPEKGLATAWDKTFSAVCFAEAGCPEIAHEMLEGKAPRKGEDNLESFLQAVGLKGVRFSYGFARI